MRFCCCRNFTNHKRNFIESLFKSYLDSEDLMNTIMMCSFHNLFSLQDWINLLSYKGLRGLRTLYIYHMLYFNNYIDFEMFLKCEQSDGYNERCFEIEKCSKIQKVFSDKTSSQSSEMR